MNFDFSDLDMPVWNRSFFAESLASDYVENISAEFEARRDSLDQFLAGLAKVMADVASPNGQTLFTARDLAKVQECQEQLKKMRDDYDITEETAEIGPLDRVTGLLKGIQAKLTTMKLRERMLIDGGWNGGDDNSGRVMYIVEKTQQEQRDVKSQRIIVKDVFSFVVSNVGPGLEYHPTQMVSSSSGIKLKYKSSFRIANIPGDRMKDLSFWSALYSLWLMPASDNNRVEVIYEVLLPWLCEITSSGVNNRTLTQAISETLNDGNARYRKIINEDKPTLIQAIEEVFRYALLASGLTLKHTKKMSYLIRRQLLQDAAGDLVLSYVSHYDNEESRRALAAASVVGINPVVEEGEPEDKRNQNIFELLIGYQSNGDYGMIELDNLVDAQGNVYDCEKLKEQQNEQIGLFVAASWSDKSKEFENLLLAAYNKINEIEPAPVKAVLEPTTDSPVAPTEDDGAAKEKPRKHRLQIICLSLDENEEAFQAWSKSHPWLSLKFSEIELRRSIGEHFDVTSVPTLLLFDSTGQLFETQGTLVVQDDKEATAFPWAKRRPPTMKERFASLATLLGGVDGTVLDLSNNSVNFNSLLNRSDVFGLFFTSMASRDGRRFAPLLNSTYEKLKAEKKKFELLLVSGDSTKEEFTKLRALVKCLAVQRDASPDETDEKALLVDIKPDDDEVKEKTVLCMKLRALFGVTSSPTLLLFNKDGDLITLNGVDLVMRDLVGDHFPWINLEARIREELLPRLTGDDVQSLTIAIKQFAASSLRAFEDKRLSDAELNHVRKYAEAFHGLLQVVSPLPALVVKNKEGVEGLAIERTTRLGKFAGYQLLNHSNSSVEKYAGEVYRSTPGKPVDFLHVPETVDDAFLVLGALSQCEATCRNLVFQMSSYVTTKAIHRLQIIALIQQLFLVTVPVPEFSIPNPKGQAANKVPCIWDNCSYTVDDQLDALNNIYQTMLIYAACWQYVENPSRSMDSERCLTSAAMLCLFDRILRLTPEHNTLAMSKVFAEDSFCLSTTGCQNNRPLEEVFRNLEIISPHYAIRRSKILDYFVNQRTHYKTEVFQYFQSENGIEMQSKDNTSQFIRKLAKKLNFNLKPYKGESEMRTIMNVFLGKETMYSYNPRSHDRQQQSNELTMTRDMVVMCKFLFTMETKESELIRRKIRRDQAPKWKISFENEGGLLPPELTTFSIEPPVWKFSRYRGKEMDIADVYVKFMSRHVLFGEGLVVHSPADLSLIIGIQKPTEDDVLHAAQLPRYNNTLSIDESEKLLSFLSVDYVRIPLVIDFFASNNRATYLFNSDLQKIFRSVLFDSGAWVSPSKRGNITKVPLRRTALQEMQYTQLISGYFSSFFKKKEDADVLHGEDELKMLGSSYGGLMNELMMSPDGVMSPLFRLLKYTKEFRGCEVHSKEANFILFLTDIVIEIQAFVIKVIEMKRLSGIPENDPVVEKLQMRLKKIEKYLFSDVQNILIRWTQETTSLGDIESASVIHCYSALLYKNITADKYTKKIVENIIGHISFVRNWHAFGMRQNRSDFLLSHDKDGEKVDNKQRLFRYLQAFGIDTESIDTQSCLNYLSKKHLFLKIGKKQRTLMIPSFQKSYQMEKLPPADLAENELFALLQSHRRGILQWIERSEEPVDDLLQEIVRIALQKPEFTYQGWIKRGDGQYIASEVEISLSIQTAEVLWKNDNLKPLPESMILFDDFKTLFGDDAFQCGVLKSQKNRQWVSIVGTQYELREWTMPDPIDQGTGVPVIVDKQVIQPKAPQAKPQPVQSTNWWDQPNQSHAATNTANNAPCASCYRTNGQCWTCPGCTVLNCIELYPDGFKNRCTCCDALVPKHLNPNLQPVQPTPKVGFSQANTQQAVVPKKPPRTIIRSAMYKGVLYSRKIDRNEVYHKHPTELWIVDLLKPIIDFYESKMSFLLPKEITAGDANKATVLASDGYGRDNSTWKEIVLIKSRGVITVYNLISWGRKMYQSQVYTSNVRFSQFGFSPKIASVKGHGSRPSCITFDGGKMHQKRVQTPSLIISRKKDASEDEAKEGPVEEFMPTRLLRGLFPSALLENFSFWRVEGANGSNTTILGYPEDDSSHWYSYRLTIVLNENGDATITRDILPHAGTSVGKDRDAQPSSPSVAIASSALSSAVPVATGGSASESLISKKSVAVGSGKKEAQTTDTVWNLKNQVSLRDSGFNKKKNYLHTAMGNAYTEKAIEAALKSTNQDLERAMDWLLDEKNSELINTLDLKHDQERQEREGLIEILVGEGYEPGQANDALTGYSNDIKLARIFLEEQKTETQKRSTAEMGRLYLNNLLDCAEGTVLHTLCGLLTRIEDVSHILVWTSRHPQQLTQSMGPLSGDVGLITMIELPRLKLTFQPKKDTDGIVRLYLLEHSGWFVSANSASASAVSLSHVIGTQFQNYLLLENHSKSLQLLVPNHDIYRPRILESPFSVVVVPDRCSATWLQVMETRYYLYPVHTTGLFLIPNSLASTLYLALVRLYQRNYSDCFKLLDSCSIDTKLKADEKWIFNMFSRADNDQSPNAHACRLKLISGVLFSMNEMPWEISIELEKYIVALSDVSSECFLSTNELIDLLQSCKQSTLFLRNILLFYLQVREYELNGAPKDASKQKVLFPTAPPRVAGLAWTTLLSNDITLLNNFNPKKKEFRYIRPFMIPKPPEKPKKKRKNKDGKEIDSDDSDYSDYSSDNEPEQPGGLFGTGIGLGTVATALAGTGTMGLISAGMAAMRGEEGAEEALAEGLDKLLSSGNDKQIRALAQIVGFQLPELKKELETDDTLDLIWSSKILDDDEAGQENGFGFLFLYEVIRGDIKLKIGEENCSKTMSELILRHWHLKFNEFSKLDKEGKQTFQTKRPSYEIAILANMLRNNLPRLKEVPTDIKSSLTLASGLKVRPIPPKGTPVPNPNAPKEPRPDGEEGSDGDDSSSGFGGGDIMSRLIDGHSVRMDQFFDDLYKAFALYQEKREKSLKAQEIAEQKAKSTGKPVAPNAAENFYFETVNQIVKRNEEITDKQRALVDVIECARTLNEKKRPHNNNTDCERRVLSEKSCSKFLHKVLTSPASIVATSLEPSQRHDLLQSLLAGTSQATLDCLATQPLNAINLALWVKSESVSSVPLEKLPFSISKHPSAQSLVAKDMLKRMEGDIATYAKQQKEASELKLSFLTMNLNEPNNITAASVESALKVALDLMSALSELERQDRKFVHDAIATIKKFANSSPLSSPTSAAVAQPASSSSTVPTTTSAAKDSNISVKSTAATTSSSTASSSTVSASNASQAALHTAASNTRESDAYELGRMAERIALLDLDYLAVCLASSTAEKDISSINPFLLPDIPDLLSVLATVMLHSNRVSHINRCLTQARTLEGILLQLLDAVNARSAQTKPSPGLATTKRKHVPDTSLDMSFKTSPQSSPTTPDKSPKSDRSEKSGSTASHSPLSPRSKDGQSRVSVDKERPSPVADPNEIPLDLLERLRHISSSLSSSLSSRRAYMQAEGGSKAADYAYDPRFLVFEFIFDLILRKGQIAMVQGFTKKLQNGESVVHQMIMGAGKTTVVGPLLSLMLANGKSLVTHVMPTALLEQSKDILRSRFSTIFKKRIFTLHFERGCPDDVEIIAKLHKKLQSATEARDLVCSSPEAVKSLFLKYIEQMDTLSKVVPTVMGSEARDNQMDLMHLMNKSEMGDAIVPILNLWKNGVLIMDEVDSLLHPLKSELNFPIGRKKAIDLAGFRWDLPIFLLDAVFYPSLGTLPEGYAQIFQYSEKIAGYKANDLLEQFKAEIAKAHFSIQRNPHFVVLDAKFYTAVLKPILAKWCLLWLLRKCPTGKSGKLDINHQIMLDYIQGSPLDDRSTNVIESNLLPDAIKLLNLAQGWINSFLPHILSKIDRVSYGILTSAHVAAADPLSPLGRLYMAVPFLGKDVPSPSSEFAHPDISIGLTILAYRYEGLRLEDVQKLIIQLKEDHGRQVGPQEKRKASLLFQKWLEVIERRKKKSTVHILPLSLFMASDRAQVQQLHRVIGMESEVIHYYLRQHVFPMCMNFQLQKISACGHELGSNILFGRRIGFSGTPSNLLPLDLGNCLYEAGSDGQIINTLTNKAIVSSYFLEKGWNAKSLLRKIASSVPSYHALIDTGALITGMDNLEVAQYLLGHLPSWMEGVVYLDDHNRQMIINRSSGIPIPLEQSGISVDRRFTVYDQVHTTGMDISQAVRARAVVTLGKDMTFRDYAQGAFRMRGIGVGQTITLFIIPEVKSLIQEQLGKQIASSKTKSTATSSSTGGELVEEKKKMKNPIIDVPAWLVINSMRMETLQFVKLSFQELSNTYRTIAIGELCEYSMANSIVASKIEGSPISSSRDLKASSKLRAPLNKDSAMLQIQRFCNEKEMIKSDRLKHCIDLFNEPIDFVVPSVIPKDEDMQQKMKQSIGERRHFLHGKSNKENEERIALILSRITSVPVMKSDQDERFKHHESEVIHENEQEAQEEAEQEAEAEEEKVSVYSREDENPVTWSTDLLMKAPYFSKEPGKEAFYRFSSFAVHKNQKKLKFPDSILLTDNVFRPRWIGMGERKLKNISLLIEWIIADQRYLIAVSLAEGETIRRVLHSKQQFLSDKCSIGVHCVESNSCMDVSANYVPSKDKNFVKSGMLCVRFFNNEMYYTDDQLELLSAALAKSSCQERKEFFIENMMLRRKDRNIWEDTPVAKLFTEQEGWYLLASHISMQRLVAGVAQAINTRIGFNPYAIFDEFDSDNDGLVTSDELQAIFGAMHLKYLTATDFNEAAMLLERNNVGKVSIASFQRALGLQSREDLSKLLVKKEEKFIQENQEWICEACTASNPPRTSVCNVCGYGDLTQFESIVDINQWMCSPEKGGCSAYNMNDQFYCIVCNRARPGLSNIF